MTLIRLNLTAEQSLTLARTGTVLLPGRRFPEGRELLIAESLHVVTDEVSYSHDPETDPRVQSITVQYLWQQGDDTTVIPIDVSRHGRAAARWSASRVDLDPQPLIRARDVPRYLINRKATVLKRDASGALLGTVSTLDTIPDLPGQIEQQIHDLKQDIQSRRASLEEQIDALRRAGDQDGSNALSKMLDDLN